MTKQYGEVYRTIRLCVDSYENGVLVGRYGHPGREGSVRAFESLAQFLTGAEAQFDEANFPQSYTAKRFFAPLAETPPGETAGAAQNGALATFTIRILFRQHASWQGSVTWHEGRAEQSFRSVLELILLIDSALGGCGEGAA